LEGDTWFSRRIIDILATPATGDDDIEDDYHLTDRESEVLRLLVEGNSNGQIAETLVIAEGTVKNHLVNIYQKLGVHSRAEAISWVLQHEVNQ
jgi:DNA-binding NarL/FixJ family response regulator